MHCTFVFSFPDDNFSKYQRIFTKLGICVNIVEVWLMIANGQYHQFLHSYHFMFSFLEKSEKIGIFG